MDLMKNLKKNDNKFTLEYIGIVLAIFFGGISIYLGFFKTDKPDLKYVITADSSVLDIKENVGNLDVLYQGESLNKRKQDLRFITFRVVNQGNSSILSNFYDSNFPVGFKVKDGEIADYPKLVDASSDYLEDRLITEMVSKTNVTFSNVIIEPNESFEVKVLVLHDIGKNPTIEPFGKIATIDKIEVVRDFSTTSELAYQNGIFGGGLGIQVLRLFGYGFAFILFAAIFAFIQMDIGRRFDRGRRRSLVSTFKEYHCDILTSKDNYLFDYYIDKGLARFLRLKDLIFTTCEVTPIESELCKELEAEGFFVIRDGNKIIDDGSVSTLDLFIGFLEKKGQFNLLHARSDMSSV